MSKGSDANGVVFRGISWTLTSRLLTQIAQLLIAIVTARLLSPSEFGTIAMVLIFSGFAQVLTDLGIGSALVQRRELGAKDVSTAFWLQVGIGVAITLLFFALAPAIAAFYGIPSLEGLTRIVSLTFVAQALGQTQASLAQREYRFKQIGIATVIATITSGTAALSMAFVGWGVNSLAWQPVIQASVFTLLLWVHSPWRPSLHFDLSVLRSMLHYGGYLSGHTMLNYWLRNGDNLVIGKVLGAVELGFYGRAYTLMLLPLNTIGMVVGQVMFPALSRLQDEKERFRSTYVYSLRAIAFVMFPLMGAIFVLSEPLIILIFGDKWLPAAPILRILSLVGFVQSVIFPVGWIFTSLGKTKTQFHLSIGLAILFSAAMYFGVMYGVLGVALAYAAWAMCSALINLKIAMEYIGVSLLETLHIIGNSLRESFVLIIFCELFHRKIKEILPIFYSFPITLLFGVILYIIICHITKNEIYVDTIKYIRIRYFTR